MIDSSLKRGSAELAVLSVLSEGKLHGYELARRIEARTGGVLRFTLASLYPLLYRLEKGALVNAEWKTAASGRRRRCYTITARGRRQLQPLQERWRTYLAALRRLPGLGDA